ncbi:MAG: FG-GAP-like repeat-containing protein [Bacteroidia bacterium]
MKFLRTLFILAFICFAAKSGYSQPFFQWNDSIKVTIGTTTLANPWAGGLNFIQASNIDLNQDGIKDLFMFDRTGNKIRTFINKGTAGSPDYRYDPSYEESKFPKMHDWALLVDYNGDGKEDIFTSTIGGITVYKNISTPATGLQFTLVKNLLYSQYWPPTGGLINLYVSSVDLPALSDIDNDGDLDIVTFENAGNRLEYHKNMSMELYGNADSLKFQVANHCWGYVSESPLTNDYTLRDTCHPNVPVPEFKPEDVLNKAYITNIDTAKSAERHTGGCEICIDLDNDGDKDFVVGDVSYPGLTMLTNTGNITHASLTISDVAFPSNNTSTAAVDLTLFPCAFYIDVNYDGIKDLVVSPNETNACENFNSVVYYKNTGTNTFPVFNYIQSNLLQDNMIEVGEGSYPVFFDYDNDGLKDLFIGNNGYYGPAPGGFVHEIAQFKNIGTSTNPKYSLVTRDYANLSTTLAGVSNMVPAFGDLDGDGDADMVIGGQDGKLQYFENTAAAGAPANFVLASANLKNSSGRTIDVGDFAAPQIFDVDGNGTNDLVVGGRNGKLAYFRHTGTTPIPVMDSITYNFGHVSVCLPGYVTGYSYPCLYKQGGVTNMMIGEETGFIRHYDNIDGNLAGTFTMVDSLFEGIFQGTRTAPNLADIDNDGLVDMIVGNYEGGVSFYKGVAALTTNDLDNQIHFNFNLFPNPANNSFSVQILNEENKTYEFELYNVMGQFISKEKISNNTLTYNTTALAAGVYICKVSEINTSGAKVTGTLIKRIVVQH